MKAPNPRLARRRLAVAIVLSLAALGLMVSAAGSAYYYWWYPTYGYTYTYPTHSYSHYYPYYYNYPYYSHYYSYPSSYTTQTNTSNVNVNGQVNNTVQIGGTWSHPYCNGSGCGTCTTCWSGSGINVQQNGAVNVSSNSSQSNWSH